MSRDHGDRDDVRSKLDEYARTRDPQLRSEVVEAHLGLADYLARRFSHRGEAHEDLAQVAALALVKAVDRFDPARGVAFSSFATKTMLGELKRHFRDKGWTVRTPRRLQELYLAIGQASSDLSQKLGRSPTVSELGAEVGASDEDVLEALEASQGYRAASLDAPLDDADQPLSERLGDLEPSFGKSEDRVTLTPLLRQLPPREQKILGLRFFAGMTQSEIAAHLGISQMHVSRLLSKSLRYLRNGVEGTDASGVS